MDPKECPNNREDAPSAIDVVDAAPEKAKPTVFDATLLAESLLVDETTGITSYAFDRSTTYTACTLRGKSGMTLGHGRSDCPLAAVNIANNDRLMRAFKANAVRIADIAAVSAIQVSGTGVGVFTTAAFIQNVKQLESLTLYIADAIPLLDKSRRIVKLEQDGFWLLLPGNHTVHKQRNLWDEIAVGTFPVGGPMPLTGKIFPDIKDAQTELLARHLRDMLEPARPRDRY